ncbi:MAG TPA: hypothetical protein VMY42_12120 [Thermoguttaceae bacterium]|nr:hypothetical protein [Thermoguttaceae bacterium]
MVKVIGPVMSLGGFQPLRKPRVKYEEEPPPPPVEKVDVTYEEFVPYPDCTGTYEYLEDHDGEHAYKRTTEPYYFIYWNAVWLRWIIALEIDYPPPDDHWYREAPINGDYEGNGEFMGYPLASEPYV